MHSTKASGSITIGHITAAKETKHLAETSNSTTITQHWRLPNQATTAVTETIAGTSIIVIENSRPESTIAASRLRCQQLSFETQAVLDLSQCHILNCYPVLSFGHYSTNSKLAA